MQIIMVLMKTVLIFVGIMTLIDISYCGQWSDPGPSGPSMDTCETYICPENSTCKDDDGFVLCECKFGKVGDNCDIENPCVERTDNCPKGSVCYGNCNPNVICEAATGISHCRGCVKGWTGLHCEKKVALCKEKVNACSNNGTCVDMNEGIQCVCKSGWTGETCECIQGSECDFSDIKDETDGTNEENGEDKNDETKTDESKSGTELKHGSSVVVLAILFLLYAIV